MDSTSMEIVKAKNSTEMDCNGSFIENNSLESWWDHNSPDKQLSCNINASCNLALIDEFSGYDLQPQCVVKERDNHIEKTVLKSNQNIGNIMCLPPSSASYEVLKPSAGMSVIFDGTHQEMLCSQDIENIAPIQNATTGKKRPANTNKQPKVSKKKQIIPLTAEELERIQLEKDRQLQELRDNAARHIAAVNEQIKREAEILKQKSVDFQNADTARKLINCSQVVRQEKQQQSVTLPLGFSKERCQRDKELALLHAQEISQQFNLPKPKVLPPPVPIIRGVSKVLCPVEVKAREISAQFNTII